MYKYDIDTAKIFVNTVVGAVTLPSITYGAFLLGGISVTGPIAGGYFASMMGASIPAGSLLALIQSVAMSQSTYVYGSMIGASIGGLLGFKNNMKPNNP
jgi:hypothetical protein